MGVRFSLWGRGLFSFIAVFVLCSIHNAQATLVGYDNYATASAHELGGDAWSNQMGIHDGYTFAEDGYITHVSVRNDSDLSIESFELLVIEILDDNNFKVLARTLITSNDENPGKTDGVTTYELSTPLAVSAGNTFAHWGSTSGAIPLNNWDTETEGGFFHGSRWIQLTTDLLDVGDTIYAPRAARYTTYRDYFINVTVVPEPATMLLLAFGGVILRRKNRA